MLVGLRKHALSKKICQCMIQMMIPPFPNSFLKEELEGKENLPVYDANDDPTFPEFLKEELGGKAGHANGNGNQIAAGEMGLDSVIRFKHVAKSQESRREERLWISVTSSAELRAAMVQMVAGNTSAGIYKDVWPQVYVDISQIISLPSPPPSDDRRILNF